jgi:hypothetical protein
VKVDTKAFISVTLNPDSIDEATLKDVKDWVAKVESFGYGDDTVVEECLLSLWRESSNVSSIGCGNHMADEPEYSDILVGTHECP